MALKTDYKNDKLDESMIGRRKYEMIKNDDGTVSFVDQTVYVQQGDIVAAENINEINENINKLVDSNFIKSSDITNISDEKIIELFTK